MSVENIKEKLSRLTAKEREVLEVYCEDVFYYEISNRLNIAEGTVKIHMHNISSKLQVTDLKRHEKKQIILDEFCPVFKSDELEPPPPEQEIIPELTEEEEKAVDELEGGLVVIEPDVIEKIFPPEDEFSRRRIPPLIIAVIIAILGAALMYLALNFFGLLRDGDIPASPDAALQSGKPDDAQEIVTVVVTPTPLPPKLTQTPFIELQTVIVIATSIPATDTPEPPTLSMEELYAQNLPIPVSAGTVLLDDDFSIEDTWDISHGFYEDEQIALRDYTDNQFTYGRTHLSFDNFILEVDGRWADGPIGGRYGLGFRFLDPENYYEFLISNDGRYSIRKYVNGFTTLFLDGYSDAISLQGIVTRFHLEANGTSMRFFVNDQFLGRVDDEEFSSGDVFLIAETPENLNYFYAVFDNFVLALHP